MFRITTPSVFAFGFVTVLFGGFQGSGFTLPVMVLNIARLWVLRLPLAYLLSRMTHMGTDGLWWGMFASNTVTALAGGAWFSTGSWKRRAPLPGGPGALASEEVLE
jgi:Na+-driven multidrug efflux pump